MKFTFEMKFDCMLNVNLLFTLYIMYGQVNNATARVQTKKPAAAVPNGKCQLFLCSWPTCAAIALFLLCLSFLPSFPIPLLWASSLPETFPLNTRTSCFFTTERTSVLPHYLVDSKNFTSTVDILLT